MKTRKKRRKRTEEQKIWTKKGSKKKQHFKSFGFPLVR